MATCPTNDAGEFVSRELAADRRVANLFVFGDRLAEAHKRMRGDS